MAAVRWLAPLGADITVSDSRPAGEWNEDFTAWCRKRGIKIDAGGHSDQACTLCSIMVTSPGIPASAPPIKQAIAAGATVVNDLVLAACFWNGKIIAVTGTNGKTTTTMFITHLLETSDIGAISAGNISPPLFEVMEHGDRGAVAVLEVSSFQLELLKEGWSLPFKKPEISVAVWLNLAPDHLDRHNDLETYGECKAHLLDLQGPDDWSVLNAHDQGMKSWLQRGAGRKAFFSVLPLENHPGAWFTEETGKLTLSLPLDKDAGMKTENYDLSGWHLSGRHNLENLAAAVTAARLAGAKPDGIKRGIESFRAPAHRFDTVAVSGGITYIDDSKATNAAAAIRAVESARGPVILIAGGLGKNEDYMPLARAVARLAARGMMRAVMLLGRHGPEIARAMADVALPDHVPVELLSASHDGQTVMNHAVSRAVHFAMPGDVVLLSPACASFDMFSDYGQRGNAFRNAVKAIACSKKVSGIGKGAIDAGQQG
jgi:UDP-N-acetylmuramoylalanine--D-glutamate ligase